MQNLNKMQDSMRDLNKIRFAWNKICSLPSWITKNKIYYEKKNVTVQKILVYQYFIRKYTTFYIYVKYFSGCPASYYVLFYRWIVIFIT